MKTGSRSSLCTTALEMHDSRTGAVGPKEKLWVAEAGSSLGKGTGQKEYLSWVWERAGAGGTELMLESN